MHLLIVYVIQTLELGNMDVQDFGNEFSVIQLDCKAGTVVVSASELPRLF